MRLLDNEKRITPAAMNMGIAAARGSVIVRMDAHVEYPADYISSLVGSWSESGADNVGGVCLTLPGRRYGHGPGGRLRHVASAWAWATRIFASASAEDRWVDTVPFGCYRREVFDRIGLFDEELVRNQDDELNLRLIRSGGRILLSPQGGLPVLRPRFAGQIVADVLSVWLFQAAGGAEGRRSDDAPPVGPAAVRAVPRRNGVGGTAECRAALPWKLVAPLALLACRQLFAGGRRLCAASPLRKSAWPWPRRCAAVFPALHFSYGMGLLAGAVEFLVLRRSTRVRCQHVHVPMTALKQTFA